MKFQPNPNDELTIDSITYRVAGHPAAPGIAYGQEGRAGTVYRLLATGDADQALKVFKPRFRLPFLVIQAERSAPFASLAGLTACRRSVFTPQRHGALLRQYPDLTYAVLMPWIEGPTWQEILLDKKPLLPERSLILARGLADILSQMEQQGIAHCDLSAPNVMLPALAQSAIRNPQSAVELIDLEGLYAPGMLRPQELSSGSAGYAHRQAAGGFWGPDADRFAGAVLLAEMLGFCDPQVVNAEWGESYFDPQEMQQDSPRYQRLVDSLRRNWGEGVAGLFERAWRSDTLTDCPTFGEWLIALPERIPVGATLVVAPAGASPPPVGEGPGVGATDLTRAQVQALMQAARQLEEAGNRDGAVMVYRQAQALASSEPALITLAREIGLVVADLEGRKVQPVTMQAPSPAVSVPPLSPATRLEADFASSERDSLQDLFERGLVALQHQAWAEAYACFDAVYQRDPNYQQAGQKVCVLRAQIDQAMRSNFQRVRTIRLYSVKSSWLSNPVVWSIAFSADERLLFAGCSDGQLRMIEVNSGKITSWNKVASEKDIFCIACHFNQLVALGLNDKSVQIRDINGGILHTLYGHDNSVLSINFSPDGALLASGSADGTVRLWRVADGTLLRTLEGHMSWVNSVVFSPEGEVLASGSEDGTVRLWRVTDGVPLRTLEGNRTPIRSVAFSPNGRVLASGSGTTIQLWRVVDGAALHTLKGHTNRVLSVAFSPDGQILASGSADHTVSLWRIADGELLCILKEHTSRVECVVFSLSKYADTDAIPLVASGSWDGTVRLWGIRSQETKT